MRDPTADLDALCECGCERLLHWFSIGHCEGCPHCKHFQKDET